MRSFLQVGAYKYAAELLAFLGSLWISRLISPAEYGIVAMVLVGYLFVSRFSNPGYTETVIREPDSADFAQGTQTIFVIHGLILCAAMCSLAFPLAWLFQDERLIYPSLVYGAVLFLYALPNAPESYLLKNKQYTRIYGVELAGTVAAIVLTLVLAYAGFSYWSLILPQLVVPLIYLLVYRRWFPIPWNLPQLGHLKMVAGKFRSLVARISKINLVEYWEEQTDNLWVGRLYGSTDLGIYNRAFLTAHLPRALAKPVIQAVLMPEWQSHVGKPGQVSKAYTLLIKAILSFASLPMVIVILFPRELSTFLWGHQWTPVGEFLGILGVVMGFQVVCSSGRPIFILMRTELWYMRYAWVQGLVVIVTVSVAIFFSIKTMALALALVILLVKVPAFSYWCLFISLKLDFKEILKTLGIPWLLCFAMWLLLVCDGHMILPVPLALLIVWSVVHGSTYLKKLVVDEKP